MYCKGTTSGNPFCGQKWPKVAKEIYFNIILLGMRRMADGDIYKPYAIINEQTFDKGKSELIK